MNRAIEIIEHCRKTHVGWRDYIRDDPDTTPLEVKIAGDVAHHERCIADYDHVLVVLRSKISRCGDGL